MAENQLLESPSAELDILECVFNHLALPPCLPDVEDHDPISVQKQILSLFIKATTFIQTHISPSPVGGTYTSVIESLKLLQTVYTEGSPSQGVLIQAFENLKDGECLMLHLPAQNAILHVWSPELSRNRSSGFYRIEASEAAARTEVVVSSSSLIWNFPGLAVQVPRETFELPSFRESLSAFIQQSMNEVYPLCADITTRAASESIESRNTAGPVLISEFLMPLFQACGKMSSVPLIQKKVRDDAVFSKGVPWRRSSFYLGLRVFIQRAFVLAHGDEGLIHFKFLICVVLGLLLEAVTKFTHPERVDFLIKKLARRLAKLEGMRAKIASDQSSKALYSGLAEWFSTRLSQSRGYLSHVWTSFKQNNTRRVYLLPHVADSRDLALLLQHSRPYIQSVLSLDSNERNQSNLSAASALPQMSTLTRQCYELSEFETTALFQATSGENVSIRTLADLIGKYLSMDKISSVYGSDPLLMSQHILLVMDLWVAMDKLAVLEYPILADYPVPFRPELLDVLHLSQLSELRRLKSIQDYLKTRTDTSLRSTIFANPSEESFAVRYFNSCGKHRQLFSSIMDEARSQEALKRALWEKINGQYERLRAQVVSTRCTTVTNYYYPYNQIHVVKSCNKCILEQRMKKMSIKVYEKPLSEDLVLAKATVFEVNPPDGYAIYRSATAKVMTTLFVKKMSNSESPPQDLSSYEPLKNFFRERTARPNVAFVSTVKSFLNTHYKRENFPVEFETIIKNNPLKWRYFDPENKVFLTDLEGSLSLAHHCNSAIPSDSLLCVPQIYRPLNAIKPQSSAAAAISQLSCPSSALVHEYAAFQDLFVGESTRWYSVLVELFSTNINVGTETALIIFSHLALQAGPQHPSGDVLRKVHVVFQDEKFCQKLLEYLRHRVEIIFDNYYENFTMDLLLTLCLRIISLSPLLSIRKSVGVVLQEAQQACANWLKILRDEFHKPLEPNQRDRLARFSLWASILCRRCTFIILQSDGYLPLQQLTAFTTSTIMLHQHFIQDAKLESATLKRALVQDFQMAYQYRNKILKIIQTWSVPFLKGFSEVWPHPCDVMKPNEMAAIDSAQSPYGWVRFSLFSTNDSIPPQKICFNYLSGHLLVDHKPVGSLPSSFAASEEIVDLLGTVNVLTMSSQVPGMDYLIRDSYNGHAIHLGLRGGEVVIRICYENDIFEIIPRSQFGKRPRRDLPAFFIDDCFHFLNLRTRKVEIRTRANVWQPNRPEAIIDLLTHRCSIKRTRELLVDPCSQLALHIASNFLSFEQAENILITQPPQSAARQGDFSNLKVQLPRFDLTFQVSPMKVLYCPQLGAYLDLDQDIGCFHGFQSYLVLTSPGNFAERSVIVPLGSIKAYIHGCHVGSYIECKEPSEEYARFKINRILGRVECAPEPELLYLKALIHAYTSLPIPDTLTGRTGVEEALLILRSGISKPWNHQLSQRSLDYLLTLAAITPTRGFYPPKSQLMESVRWKNYLTVSIQSNQFRPVVQDIFNSVESIFPFQSDARENTDMAEQIEEQLKPCSEYLMRRADQRVQTYSRCLSEPVPLEAGTRYSSRDVIEKPHISKRVYGISQMCNNPSSLGFTQDLRIVDFLKKYDEISGYFAPSTKVLVGDLLSLSPGSEWGPLVALFQQWGQEDKFTVMFHAGLLAFRQDIPLYYIQALLAFAFQPDLKLITQSSSAPQFPRFVEFSSFSEPDFDCFLSFAKKHAIPYEEPEEASLGHFLSSRMTSMLQARYEKYQSQVQGDCIVIANVLYDHWPAEDIEDCYIPESSYVDVDALKSELAPLWEQWFENYSLETHLHDLQSTLKAQVGPTQLPEYRPWSTFTRTVIARVPHGVVIPSLFDILSSTILPDSMPLVPPHLNTPSHDDDLNISMEKHSKDLAKLKVILNTFLGSKSALRKEYGQSLNKSFDALAQLAQRSDSEQGRRIIGQFNQAQAAFCQAKNLHFEMLRAFHSCLKTSDAKNRWLRLGHLWPSTYAHDLLTEIASVKRRKHSARMYQFLILLGLSVANFQRWLRVCRAMCHRQNMIVDAEIKNVGHTNWNPAEYPDWLLFEIEANLMIRPKQVDVALAMIKPESNSNSVLQLNMGQGKTSVIIPMVACVLADGHRLVRIVVPPSLLVQTSQLIQARLGGLVGRELKHIPFSRSTAITSDSLRAYSEIHYRMLKHGGIMLCLPEHIMSFRLCGLQNLSDHKLPVARPMVEFQSWLDTHARDVLDECDHTLAVRTQLIYTSGANLTLPGHPHRWKIVQEILRLVLVHLPEIKQYYPESIEIVSRPQGEFPFIYFLRPDAEAALLDKLINDICAGRTPILPSHLCDPNKTSYIKNFLTNPTVSESVFSTIDKFLAENPALSDAVYLVRGLFVHRILTFSFQKRWNVQYGLHPNRKPLSVPFQAKGVPSEQAEWGHPDVAIMFTCLSFYYGGLNRQQLVDNLTHLQSLDDPSTVYKGWVESAASIPDSLANWDSVHIEDSDTLSQLWCSFRYNLTVIDYCLNNHVFPKYAKQYQFKLAASGWDLIQNQLDHPADKAEATKSYPKPLTTGFSGTNDNRNLLPLTVAQVDLPSLLHTNAEVLAYLLAPRNETVYTLEYAPTKQHNSNQLDSRFESTSTEHELLQFLVKKRIKVLIDVGAHILEMDNITLARTWLELDTEAKAAVYFQQDKPHVLARNRKKAVPLLSSYHANSLEDCLVYLDQAHTRGTDLNLPFNSRGALTLGLDLTKDQVTQAAMRLRRLGTTQSVCFISPREVTHRIRDMLELGSQPLLSYHVVSWLLEQTCEGLESLQSLFYSQGMDYCSRVQARLDSPNFLLDPAENKRYCQALLQAEPTTLGELYDPRLAIKRTHFEPVTPELNALVAKLQQLRDRFEENGVAVHGSMLQEVEVEQEHEVQSQMEAVREIQRPLQYQTRVFPGLHPDIIQFLERGYHNLASPAILPAFSVLAKLFSEKKVNPKTSAFEALSPGSASFGTIPKRLYMSDEFFRITKQNKFPPVFRDFRWILWSNVAEVGVLVIQEEAEEIVRRLRQLNGSAPTHLLTYSAPVSRDTLKSFNDLSFFAVPALPGGWKAPAWFILELGLVAGRVYFEWKEYQDLCKFLGLAPNEVADESGSLLFGLDDMFASLSLSGASGNKSKPGFKSSDIPLPPQFILDYFAIIRKGQDISQTPMNYVLHRQPLRQSFHFFDRPDQVGVRQAKAKTRQNLLRSTDQTAGEDKNGFASGDEDDYDVVEYDGPDGLAGLVDDEYEHLNWDRDPDPEKDGEGDGVVAGAGAAKEAWSGDGEPKMADWQKVAVDGSSAGQE